MLWDREVVGKEKEKIKEKGRKKINRDIEVLGKEKEKKKKEKEKGEDKQGKNKE